MIDSLIPFADISERKQSTEPVLFVEVPLDIDIGVVKESEEHFHQHNLVLDQDVEKISNTNSQGDRKDATELL